MRVGLRSARRTCEACPSAEKPRVLRSARLEGSAMGRAVISRSVIGVEVFCGFTLGRG